MDAERAAHERRLASRTATWSGSSRSWAASKRTSEAAWADAVRHGPKGVPIEGPTGSSEAGERFVAAG